MNRLPWTERHLQSSTTGASSPTTDRDRKAAADGAAGTEQAVKNFVLDTNVLLHDANSIFAFDEHNVVIPFAVIEELDTFKKGNDDIARAARAVIRYLDRLRGRGSLLESVPWQAADAPGHYDGPTGTIRIAISDEKAPYAIQKESPDNRIIAIAWALQQSGKRTVFVSKDINARIKADALGICAEDYEHQKVDVDQLYTGFITINTPGELIDELYQQRMLSLESVEAYLAEASEDGAAAPIDANQFVLLRDKVEESHSGVARRLADTDHLIAVTGPRKPVYSVIARNIQQTMALDLLLDDEVRMVTLTGGAGTGKTLLALAAGMHKVYQEETYERLLVARPIMPMGRDIGYLPGDKDEKLAAWMQPIFDNLDYLISARGSQMQHAESRSTEQRIEKLLADGRLILEPLTYIRGRSIPHQYMIVDEAQNLTPHEVKTIVSRVGEDTKLVLTGDVEQIDNPYLDASSNGLSAAIEKMRGEGLVGHVSLVKSERSDLASLAAARL